MRELSMMVYFTEFTRRMLVPLKKSMFHILPHSCQVTSSKGFGPNSTNAHAHGLALQTLSLAVSLHRMHYQGATIQGHIIHKPTHHCQYCQHHLHNNNKVTDDKYIEAEGNGLISNSNNCICIN